MPFQVLDPATALGAPLAMQTATDALADPLTGVGETLGSIREELQSELGNRVNTGEGRWNTWINWGYKHVCSMVTLKELEGSIPVSITANYDFYMLPTGVAIARRLSIIDTTDYATGGIELEKIGYTTYRKLANSTLIVTFAEPTKWFRFRRMLVVWPTPSTARTAALDCKIRPNPLQQDEDSPLLPEEFHEAIILAARYRAERSLRMKDAAKDTYNDMLTILRPIIDTDAEETVTQRNQAYMPSVLRRVFSGSERRSRRWWGWGRF